MPLTGFGADIAGTHLPVGGGGCRVAATHIRPQGSLREGALRATDGRPYKSLGEYAQSKART